MNKPFLEIAIENVHFPSFDIKPIKGYEAPANFPDCCPYHRDVLNKVNLWYSKFPNCCEAHTAMQKKWQFEQDKFAGVPIKVLQQLSYTEYHISKQIDRQDWYKDITDYIQYNVSSFGQPAVGLHEYLVNLKHYISTAPIEKPIEKKEKLIEYISGYYGKPDEPTTNFSSLYEIYEEWLNAFPFELSFFSALKPDFEKRIPFLAEEPEYNKYLGTSKAKMHTPSSLIEVLIELTENLLSDINGLKLYKQGLITDANKNQIELINANRRIELAQIKDKSKAGREAYIEIIKDWLKGEKEYFKEIAPFVPKQISLSKNAKSKPKVFYTQSQVAIAYYVLGVTITNENYNQILSKHSQSVSKKILQKRISKPNQLTTISGNKTADTKHWQDLEAAKRLLSGMKKNKEVEDLDRIIKAFQTAYDNEY